MTKECYHIIRTKLDPKRWDANAFNLCISKYLRHKFEKPRFTVENRWWSSPCTKIDPCENYLFASSMHKIPNLLKYLFFWTPLVPTTCLDCQTKCTEVITPCLNDHVFSRKKFLPLEFCERTNLGLHLEFSLDRWESKIIRILRKYLNLLYIWRKLMICIKKG